MTCAGDRLCCCETQDCLCFIRHQDTVPNVLDNEQVGEPLPVAACGAQPPSV